jgi:hypothetical protein
MGSNMGGKWKIHASINTSVKTEGAGANAPKIRFQHGLQYTGTHYKAQTSAYGTITCMSDYGQGLDW